MCARAEKPRILLLESLPIISGGQSVLLSLARSMRTGHDLLALLPGEGPLARALSDIGVRCNFAPMGGYSLVHKSLGDVLSYALRLPGLTLLTCGLVLRQQVDLIYAGSARTFTWGTLASTLANRPTLWHHHSVLADRKTLALVRAVGRLPAVRTIICASQEACAQLPALTHKSVVIPSGVDLSKFRPDPALGLAVRGELGIPVASPVLGIVGDIIPLKGQGVFLEAARVVAEHWPDAFFLVVGSPRADPSSQRYSQELRVLAESLGLNRRVIFTGHRSDIPAVLNALDALVIASSTETGPLVLLEALACGVPVVSTPVGRAPELLEDGVVGFLYDTGDHEGLARRLRSILTDHRSADNMGRAARRIAEQRLGQEQSIQQIHEQIRLALQT